MPCVWLSDWFSVSPPWIWVPFNWVPGVPLKRHPCSNTQYPSQRHKDEDIVLSPHLPALFFAFLTLMPALFVPFLPQYAWGTQKPDGNRNGNNLRSVSHWFRAITCGSYRLELSCLLYIGGPLSAAFCGFINFIWKLYDSAGIWPVWGLLSGRIESDKHEVWRASVENWAASNWTDMTEIGYIVK